METEEPAVRFLGEIPLDRSLGHIQRNNDDSPSFVIPFKEGCRVFRTWLEAPLDSEWVVALRIVPQNGEPVIAELRVFPNHPDRSRPGEWAAELADQTECEVPDGGLTAQKVREVKIGQLRDQYEEILSQWHAREVKKGSSLKGFLEIQGWSPDAGFRPKERQRGKQAPDSYYAQIATIYLQKIRDGSRRPNVDTAAHLSNQQPHPVSQTQVRGWILEARRRRLLSKPAGGQGSPGGSLTPKGLAALEEGTGNLAPDQGDISNGQH